MITLLFDIDGTLISTGGAGRAALNAAMLEEFAVPEPAEVPVSGRTDRGIARNLFRAHDLEDNEENWLRFRRAYLHHLRQELPARGGEVLPGVTALLAHLQSRSDVLLGLLTGNIRDGAQMKLEHYGLHEHFDFGGFGDLHADRDLVAAAALAESKQHAQRRGWTAAADQVWVIGDTPLDVTCARAIGASVVAVATGSFDRETLEVYEPDLLFDSLLDHPQLLARFR
ncbi:MAG: HAD family hydrolase [Planctomycetota bacterium]